MMGAPMFDLHDGTNTEAGSVSGAEHRRSMATDVRNGSENEMRAVSDSELADNIRLVAQRLRGLGRSGLDHPADPLMILATTTLAYALEAQKRLLATRKRLAHLERLSITDELTGLLNRRGFEDRLRQELASAHRSAEGGILIFIDLDGFKAINDTLGHEAGDEVLRQMATLLRANVRESDCLGRLGGDEFVVLMPHSQAHHGLIRATRLETILNGSYATWRGQAIALRASCGTCTFDASADWRRVMREADLAMYAKKEGARASRAANRDGDLGHAGTWGFAPRSGGRSTRGPADDPNANEDKAGWDDTDWPAVAYV